MTTWGSKEKDFLEVAVAAIPRVTEIVAAYPAEYRSGALETAERCYMEAARDFGCTEVAALTRVSEVMGNLRTQVAAVAAWQAASGQLA
jgi:ABC-type arginine transport system permease subunit